MKLLIRWLITAIALFVATLIVPGISIESDRAFIAVAITAAILGLVNAFLRPVLAFLACGFIVLTLGIGLLFINAGTLWLSSWISQEWFNIAFIVDGFWPAFWGGIVVSIVSFLLSIFAYDEPKKGKAVAVRG